MNRIVYKYTIKHIDDDGFCFSYLGNTEREARNAFTTNPDVMSWRDWYKSGYRCVKVKIIEIH